MPTSRLLLAAALALMATAALAQNPAPAPAFGPEWKRLLGDWSGAGGGTPGESAGGSSFRFELDGHVLVRRNVSDVPAAEGRPATHHEDLLILSPGASPAHASAVYFDNEGHVIRYDAAWSADGATLTLLSSAEVPGPRFRLTYEFPAAGTTTVSFEVAAPGGEFRKYVGGVLKRASGH